MKYTKIKYKSYRKCGSESSFPHQNEKDTRKCVFFVLQGDKTIEPVIFCGAKKSLSALFYYPWSNIILLW